MYKTTELCFYDSEWSLVDVDRLNYKELERKLLYHPSVATQVEFLYDDPLLILRLKALGADYANYS